jgi:hypothetical protein
MRLRGLSRIPRLESLPTADGKSTEFTRSIGRRSLFVYRIPARAKGIFFRGLIRAGHKRGLILPQAFH